MSADKVLKLIKEKNITYVDFRFADVRGVQQHITYPAASIDESTFEDGKMFDGSSISGWKGINESDMVLMPDPDTAIVDPFLADLNRMLRWRLGGRIPAHFGIGVPSLNLVGLDRLGVVRFPDAQRHVVDHLHLVATDIDQLFILWQQRSNWCEAIHRPLVQRNQILAVRADRIAFCHRDVADVVLHGNFVGHLIAVRIIATQ